MWRTDYKVVPVVQLAAHAKSSTLYGRTVVRSYSRTVVQSYGRTVVRSMVVWSYDCTVVQLYGPTVVWSYSHTVVQLYSRTSRFFWLDGLLLFCNI